MKERLTNNLGLKLLAIFLAFFVWLLVANVSNPIVPGTKEITVDILNEHILSDNNLTYEVVGKSTVSVSYEVHTLDAYKISAGDFRAYADLSQLYDITGSIPVTIEMVNNKNLIQGQPYAAPGVIRIATEELQKKRFDLQYRTMGDPEGEYVIGQVNLSPGYVYVEGAVSIIGKIHSVGIEIPTEGVNAGFTGTAAPVFYDANDNKLSLGEDVTLSMTEIPYQVSVLKVKNLSLDFQTEGKVAEGYRFTGVESDVKSISVEGMKSALAQLTTLTVPGTELSLDGASKNVVYKVDLAKLLPEQVTIAGDSPSVATVTLKVEPLEVRGFKLNTADIKLQGTSDDYEYTIGKKMVQVNIKGLSEDLDSLETKNLEASIPVSHMTEGTNFGELIITLGEGFELVDYETVEVQVELKGQPAGVTGTAESESNSAAEPEAQETHASETTEAAE